MDAQLMIMVMLGLIVFGMFYAQAQLKNRIHCSFRRANLTKVHKFVPEKSKHVVFDGARYNVNTNRIALLWYNKGIHQFFPQWVPSLDFTFSNAEPLDPRNFKSGWDTPEAREAAAGEGSWMAFNRGMGKQLGAQSKLSNLMPILTVIAIGAILIVGYLTYMQSQHLAAQGMAIDAILIKLGIVQ